MQKIENESADCDDIGDGCSFLNPPFRPEEEWRLRTANMPKWKKREGKDGCKLPFPLCSPITPQPIERVAETGLEPVKKIDK